MMSYLWILLFSGALLAGRANTQDDVAPTEDATVHSTLLPEIVENLDLHAEAGIEKIVPVSEPEPTDAGAHEHVTPPEGEVQPDAPSETEPEPDQSQPEATADKEPEATIEGEAETAPKGEEESIAEPEPEAAAEPEPEAAAGPAAEPQAAAEPEPDAAAGPAAEPTAAAEQAAAPEPEAEDAAEPEPEAAAGPAAEPEAAAEPEPDAAAGPAAEPTAAAEPAAAPEPEAEDAADPEPEAPAEPEPDATAEGETESEAAESEAASSTQGPAAGPEHPESAQDIPDVDEEPSTSTADVSHAHEEHGSEDEGTAGADAAVPHDQSAHEGVEVDVGTEIKAQVPSDGGFNLEDALSRGNAQDTPAHSGRSKNAGSVAHAAEATGGEINTEESGSGSLAAILCAVGVAFVGAGTAYYTYQKKKLCFKNLHEEDPEAARKADAGEAQSDPQVLSNLLNSS